jgi:hypothetical protein
MRPTRVCSTVKGTQENNRRTITPAIAAKYGMAKNNCKDTSQLMRQVVDRGRELRVDGCLSDDYGRNKVTYTEVFAARALCDVGNCRKQTNSSNNFGIIA